MGKFILVIYRYRPIRKLDLSAVIGIGRYGKKLIDRTLLNTISCDIQKTLDLVGYEVDGAVGQPEGVNEMYISYNYILGKNAQSC